MAKRLKEVDQKEQQVHATHTAALKAKQSEIEKRDASIQALKKTVAQQETDITLLRKELQTQTEHAQELDDEMTLKASENNRLREQVADFETALKDLY